MHPTAQPMIARRCPSSRSRAPAGQWPPVGVWWALELVAVKAVDHYPTPLPADRYELVLMVGQCVLSLVQRDGYRDSQCDVDHWGSVWEVSGPGAVFELTNADLTPAENLGGEAIAARHAVVIM